MENSTTYKERLQMNVVVAGGGTAGWLTAIYVKKTHPSYNVTLIESQDIGILGAGEGSTPHLIQFLDYLGIPTSSLIRKCKTTIKNGIKFSNWNNNGTHYYHPFLSKSNASNDHNFPLDFYAEQDSNFSHLYASMFGHEMKDYVLMQKMSDGMRVPFVKNKEKLDVYADPILNFSQCAAWSIHFDARLIADFLKDYGISIGINRVEGIINKIEQDSDGYIMSVSTDTDTVPVNFIFDCTGFRRLIIGNTYNSQWKSHAENLPAKKAIPFFLDKEDRIPPYTESIAMNYGWTWKIPLQHRYGCGYVFDSDFISDEDAKAEVDRFVGHEVDSPRTFSFDAGCYREVWIKNCLAVGLSSGFIEPLEATSIMQSILVLRRFVSSSYNFVTRTQGVIDKFNRKYLDETQEVVDFIYLHYMTNKKNTVFWENFTRNNKMPDFVRYIMEVCKDRPLYNDFDFTDKEIFKSYAYSYVLLGNGLLSNDQVSLFSRYLTYDKSREYASILSNQDPLIDQCEDHSGFISCMYNTNMDERNN